MKMLSKDLIYNPNKCELNLKENCDLRLYLIVNKTVLNNASRGKEDAQIGHAVEMFTEHVTALKTQNKALEPFLKEYSKTRKKIVLEADEKKCIELEKLGYISVRDNGLTEIKKNSLTVIVVGILDKNTDLKDIKRLQLRK